MIHFYLAHPVRPIEGETYLGNIARAERWYRWARRRWPHDLVICQWLVDLYSGADNDADASQRAAGLRRCEAQVSRCDAILLVGGRISDGMRRELAVAQYEQLEVVDLVHLGAEPPAGEA